MTMIERKTIFSPDRFYRYTLWRDWADDCLELEEREGNNSAKYVQFIGLNPSTADETKDDPTIRRCMAFAKSWGFGAMCMTNLFAYRATDPKKMKSCRLAVGQKNRTYLMQVALEAGLIVAAWGTHGIHEYQDINVRRWIADTGRELHCLGKSKDGHPKHPLYLKADLKPIPFQP